MMKAPFYLLFFLFCFLQSYCNFSDAKISGYFNINEEYDNLNKTCPLNLDNIANKSNLSSTFKSTLFINVPFDIGTTIFEFEDIYANSFLTNNSYDNSISMREAYFSINQSDLFIKIGKQRVKWGTGFMFNPSDFVNISKTIKDVNSKIQTDGKTMINISYIPSDVFSLNEIFLLNDAKNIEDIPMISRINCLIYNIDSYVFIKNKSNDDPSYGCGFTWSPFEKSNFILYGEALYQTNVVRAAVDDSLSIVTQNIPRQYGGVLGLNLSINDKTSYISEFYYNNLNWSKGYFSNYLNLVNSSQSNPLILASAYPMYVPLNNSHYYLYQNLSIMQFFDDSLAFSAGMIINLEDMSSLLMPTFEYAGGNSFRYYWRGTFANGAADSEFKNMPNNFSMEFGVYTYI